jgi:hypothetical protein
MKVYLVCFSKTGDWDYSMVVGVYRKLDYAMDHARQDRKYCKLFEADTAEPTEQMTEIEVTTSRVG